MLSGSSTSPTLAAGAVGLAVCTTIGWALLAKSPNESISRDEQGDTIAADEVAQVFDCLFMEMQGVVSQLMQLLQALQMSGQNIPDQQLKGLLRAEMERALLAKQEKVVNGFDMDYACFEEATWEFLEDSVAFPRVAKAVDRFQKLWEGVTGDEVTGWRPGKATAKHEILESDTLIALAEKFFEAQTESMRHVIADYKDKNRNLRDPSIQQQMNFDFTRRASDVGETVLAKEGVTESQFQASIKAHSGDAAVARALAMMQLKQQQELGSLGP